MGPSPTALRFSVAWPVAKLTALTAFAAFKQAATSQLLMRAARAATRPAMLGASEALRSLPGRAFAATVEVFAANSNTRWLRGRCCPAGAISGATSSAGPGSARAARFVL